MVVLRRYLDVQEARALNVNALQVAEYTGHLQDDLLFKAIEHLSRRYPVLCARVRLDTNGYMLEVPPGRLPPVKTLQGGEESLRAVVRGGLDPAEAVAEFILVRGSTKGYVGLHMDHAVTNGGSFTLIFADLWCLYTDLVEGKALSIEPSDALPQAPSEIIGKDKGYSSLAKYADTNYDLTVARIQLTGEETRRIVAVGRERGISVHGMMCGAAVVSQRAQGRWPRGSAEMVCLQPVDLSRRLKRPVRPTESTNLHRRHMVRVMVDENADSLTVGNEIQTQLRTAIARQELVPGDISPFLENHEKHLNIVSVSSLGVLPQLRHPDGLAIEDLLAYGRAAPTPYPGHGVHTYNGRLTVTSLYPDAFFRPEETSQISGRIQSELRSISDLAEH